MNDAICNFNIIYYLIICINNNLHEERKFVKLNRKWKLNIFLHSNVHIVQGRIIVSFIYKVLKQ